MLEFGCKCQRFCSWLVHVTRERWKVEEWTSPFWLQVNLFFIVPSGEEKYGKSRKKLETKITSWINVQTFRYNSLVWQRKNTILFFWVCFLAGIFYHQFFVLFIKVAYSSHLLWSKKCDALFVFSLFCFHIEYIFQRKSIPSYLPTGITSFELSAIMVAATSN